MTTENQNPEQTPEEIAAAEAAARAAATKAPEGTGVSLEPTEAKKDEPAAEVYDHELTGNPAIDIALEFIGQRGIKEDDPAVVAARAGDFSKIKEKLGGMGDKAKGWERQVALVEREYAAEQAKAIAARDKTQALVDTAVGGNENWKLIAEWAGNEASPEQKKQINAALNAGGMAASAVAKELKRQFDAKVGKSGKQAASPDAAGPAQGTGPMTAAEYGRAVAELQAKFPTKDITQTREYAALRTARMASRSAGVK